MGNKLRIEGEDFTSDVIDGLEDIKISFGQEDNTYGFSTSTSITLGKRGYNLIKDTFFTSCKNIQNTLKLAYFNCKCDRWFPLQLGWQDLEICDFDCQTTIKLTEQSSAKECIKYLDSHFIGEDGYSSAATLYKLNYAKQGGFLQQALLIFLPIFTLMLISVTIILNVVIALCQAVQFILNTIASIIGGIFGVFGAIGSAIGGLFSSSNNFEINGISISDISPSDVSSLSCEEILFLTTYNGNSTGITQDQVDLICNGGEAECEQIFKDLLGLTDVILQDHLDEYCSFIAIQLGLTSLNVEDSGFNIDICPDFIPLDSLACNLTEFVTGTGNYFVSIRLKEVFIYYADRCNLKFRSSIFDGSYHDLAIALSTTTTASQNQDIAKWYQENTPAFTIKEIFDDLAKNVFNAELIIKGDELIFEPKVVIDNLREQFATWESIEGRLQKAPCISFVEKAAPAFLDFSYCDDSLNRSASSQRRLFEGNVEWNPEGAEWKEDSITVKSGIFSASHRFMFDDKIERNNSFINFDLELDKLRTGDYEASLEATFIRLLVGGPLSLFKGLIAKFLDCGVRRECDLILSGDTTTCTPLFILEPNTPQEDAKVIRRDTGRKEQGYSIYDYNFPLSMIRRNDDDSFTTGELYQFWDIEDPNKSGRELYEFSEFRFGYTCEEFLKAASLGSCGWYIPTPYGRLNIGVLDFDTKECTVSIGSGVIRCFGD